MRADARNWGIDWHPCAVLVRKIRAHDSRLIPLRCANAASGGKILTSSMGCRARHGICTILDQCASRVPVRFGGRLVRETQSTAIGRATRRTARIHGGIKARENNVEESVILGSLPPVGNSRNQRDSPHWHGLGGRGRRRVLRNG